MVPNVAQWADCVNMAMGIRQLYREGYFTVCEILGSHSIVTGTRHRADWQTVTGVSEELAALYSVCRNSRTSSPKRR
jgi:hypothetical protein